MKRGMKILLGILIPIFIIVVLMLTGIIPNPFIDTSELTCNRENKFDTYIETETIIAEFNYNATIKKYYEIYIIAFEKNEDLNEYEEYLKSVNEDYTYNEAEKSIETKQEIKITHKNNYYKKTRKEMKNIFLNELYYSKCE